jgi:3-oxoacyl-[acyl-carrier-protein] synthase III
MRIEEGLFFFAPLDFGGPPNPQEQQTNLFANKENTIRFPPFHGLSGIVMPLGRIVSNEQAIGELGLTRLNDNNEPIPLTPEGLAKMTGFRQRSWIDGVPPENQFPTQTSYGTWLRDNLFGPAGKEAITQGLAVANMQPGDIDKWFVGSTDGPDGLPEALLLGKDAFYIRAACPAGGLLLHELWQREDQYLGKNVFAVFSEILSPVTPPDITRAIFADTATTVLVQNYGERFRVLYSAFVPTPDTDNVLQARPLYENPPGFDWSDPSQMVQITDRGMTVFYRPSTSEYRVVIGPKLAEWVKNSVLPTIVTFVDNYNKMHPGEEIDLSQIMIVGHQANGKMLTNSERNLMGLLAKKNQAVSRVRMPFVYDDVGNTSGPAVLGALNMIVRDPQYVDFSDGKPKRLLVIGFGAGLLCTCALVEIR